MESHDCIVERIYLPDTLAVVCSNAGRMLANDIVASAWRGFGRHAKDVQQAAVRLQTRLNSQVAKALTSAVYRVRSAVIERSADRRSG